MLFFHYYTIDNIIFIVILVPGIVQDLKITAKIPPNITVEWKPPSTPNGVIITYEVCSWILDRDKCSHQSNTTETEETITGLGEYT